MKQLHTLLDGRLVLIDYISKEPKDASEIELHYYEAKIRNAQLSAIPTLEQDRSTWLELSERCGGKISDNDYKLINGDKIIDFEGSESYPIYETVAIPTPKTENLWEEIISIIENWRKHGWEDAIIISRLKTTYNLTRNS